MSVDNVKTFWTWFAHCVGRAGFSYTDASFVEDLDRRISCLFPKCSWEIGPDTKDPDGVFLAISPCRSRERQETIKQAVQHAPVIPGWHFYSAKPIKVWDRKVILDRGSAAQAAVDAQNLRLAIDRTADGVTVYVLFMTTGLTHAQRQFCADLFVESELGEQAMIDMNVTVRATVEHSMRSDWKMFDALKVAFGGWH